jgi:hypothetical protein
MLFLVPIGGIKPKDIITQSSHITQTLIKDLKEKKE